MIKCGDSEDALKKMTKQSYRDAVLTVWQCRWAVKKIEKDGVKIKLVQSS